ncbi:hypothetical protein [Cellulosilyticum sp. I15G10I2]|uniref:hypothetical protein n=1 Tax=Cellulosilyticum sp. I15G10I2 TaxID=1892843 RepID=UPI00085C3554|nr:hypothetical protein [Cellulosilyticum sp. I15G10I2]
MKCRNCGEIINCEITDVDSKITFAWFNMLLESIDSLPFETKREVVKGCSISHFNAINMEDILKTYIGDVYSFIKFLETEWNWSVQINEGERVIYADENKSQCICPIVKLGEIKTSLMCNCSEGFAEKMFTKVLQRNANAKVISSILNGDKSCAYEIRWGQ